MARRTPSPVPRLVRGSVFIHRRSCGKPTCRCAKGGLHESAVLSYSDRGRTRLVMLPASQVAAVRAATDRYRAARARLEEQGNAGLATLVASLAAVPSGRRA